MSETEFIPVKVTDDAQIRVEVTRLDQGRASSMNQDIAIPTIPNLDKVWEMISHISTAIGEKLEKAKAKKAVVEFGIEIGLEGGQLTAMLLKGTGKAKCQDHARMELARWLLHVATSLMPALKICFVTAWFGYHREGQVFLSPLISY